MARKSKASFKMKGHTLPGINQKSETVNIKDGRSPSSAFQQNSPVKNYKDTTKYKAFEGGNEAGSVLKQKVDPEDIKGPKTEGNIKLQPSENPDVDITGGKNAFVSNKIADYEDRIQFLEDDFEGGAQQKKDIAKLKQELAILLRDSKKPPFKKKKY